MTLRPLYMWAGGKTRLLRHYSTVWPDMTDYDHYVEPFLGGASVFGWVHSNHPRLPATLGDSNSEIIGLLQAIKTDPLAFLKELDSLTAEYFSVNPAKNNRKAWYYRQRRLYWQNPTPARLFLLMRLSFNGIWQTCKGSKGLFGTPAGLFNHRRPDQIYTAEHILAWSKALSNATLFACDYRDLPIPGGRCLIYLDPPYRASFTTYSADFDDDQAELAAWFRAQARQGSKVLLSNRCVDGDTFFEDLLGDIADFHYFDVTYTAGHRKATETGYEAKKAREFLAISR